MSTMGLEQEDVEAMVAHDSCNWNSLEWRHKCKLDRRIAGCKTEAESLQNAQLPYRRSVAEGLVIALLYRWKNMGRANVWLMRARGERRILDFVLQDMWSEKDRLDAEGKLEAAFNADEVDYQVKANVKATLVIKAFLSDPLNEDTFRCHILTAPVQRCLHATFQADKLSCSMNAAMAVDPDSQAAEDAKAEVFRINMSFFSGKRGHTVV